MAKCVVRWRCKNRAVIFLLSFCFLHLLFGTTRIDPWMPLTYTVMETNTNTTTIREPKDNDNHTTHTQPMFAIFFHTFSGNNTTLTLDIITSQLRIVNSQPLLDDVTIYYSRIGDLNWEWPMSECKGWRKSPSRECIQASAQEKGDESVTLQHLYEYCVQYPSHHILYMHSKGSYTSTVSNDRLRTVALKGITSIACLKYANEPNDAQHGRQCNSCSSQLFSHPLHYTGNMWVSDCDYVSTLIPPKHFQTAKEMLHSKMMNRTKALPGNKFYETKFDDGTNYQFHKRQYWQLESSQWYAYTGLGRWANEHWLASHPDFRPCETFSILDGNPPLPYDMSGVPLNVIHNLTARLRRAPSGVCTDDKLNYRRMNPWLKRDGRLQQYKALYSKVPDKNSWFYTYWKD